MFGRVSLVLSLVLPTLAADAVLVPPSSVSVLQGVQSGTFSDLALTDSQYFVVGNPAPGIGFQHSSWTVTGNFSGLLTIGTVEVVDRMFGIGQYDRRIEAFNWAANAYVTIDVRLLQPGVTTATIPLPSPITDYRNGSNDLRLRIRVIQVGTSALFMSHQVDRLNWDL
ncbi:MAG: hypothetical protein JNM34_04345 [Chthonomonadaceae bacterium]|nr:hypothetical protein [Chthonomonadaceae bacterium]